MSRRERARSWLRKQAKQSIHPKLPVEQWVAAWQRSLEAALLAEWRKALKPLEGLFADMEKAAKASAKEELDADYFDGVTDGNGECLSIVRRLLAEVDG